MNVKYHGPVGLAYTVTYMTRPLWEVTWPRKAQERCRTLFFKCIVPDSLHVSFFSASSSYWSYKYVHSQKNRVGFRRCWTHTRKLSQPGSSHQTTSRWLGWRGWRSCGCALRPAAGWSLSPSSWSAHWSPIGPTTGPQSPGHWCPARCAPLGRCSDAHSCGDGRSRLLLEEWPDCHLWRCSRHWPHGRSSSRGRPGNTCRGSWCLADKLRGRLGQSQCGSGVIVALEHRRAVKVMLKCVRNHLSVELGSLSPDSALEQCHRSASSAPQSQHCLQSLLKGQECKMSLFLTRFFSTGVL